MRGRTAGKDSTSGLTSGKRTPSAGPENDRSLLSTRASGVATRGEFIGADDLHKLAEPRVAVITPFRSNAGAPAASTAAALEAPQQGGSRKAPLKTGGFDPAQHECQISGPHAAPWWRQASANGSYWPPIADLRAARSLRRVRSSSPSTSSITSSASTSSSAPCSHRSPYSPSGSRFPPG